ncbi:hypothetical protein EPO56_00775 [Patescibacteria group bacterium]|nr:MAG: hypothetical protein EPO56_00775 [Patescibacteria group bacterium]
MEIKLVFAVVSTLLSAVGMIPYIVGMIRGKTHPHVYTWLIWTLSVGTAALGAWIGGGEYGALALSIGFGMTFVIFIFSLFYGTKNITRSDTIALIGALIAIGIWWLFNNPYIALALVTIIDAIGYIPSMRKSLVEPWSEPISTWTLFTLAPLFTIASLSSYNFLTLTYVGMTVIANVLLLGIIYFKRQSIPRPVAKFLN